MPTRLSWFADLGLSYVLGGHFHSTFTIRTFGDGGFFVYPGSPVSVTKKETGQRAVNLFQTGSAPVQFYLDTAHYVDEEIVCDPFSDRRPGSDLVSERLEGLHPERGAARLGQGLYRRRSPRDQRILASGRDQEDRKKQGRCGRIFREGHLIDPVRRPLFGLRESGFPPRDRTMSGGRASQGW